MHKLQRRNIPSKKGEPIVKQQKKYLDLTNDRAFKTFFSQNKDMLLSLLKAFLPLPDKKTVKSVRLIKTKKQRKKAKQTKKAKRQQFTIKDSFLYPDSIKEKQSILDINVSLNTGEKVDVEMQAVYKKAFIDRVLYYWARLYTSGLKMSQDYSLLHPTYSLIFTKFPVFDLTKNRGFVTSFSIRSDHHPHFVLNPHLRMVFIELSQFKKSETEDLLDSQEKWCYLLKESGRLTSKKAKLLTKKGEDMSKAVGLLDDLSMSEYESLLKKTKEKEYRDKISREAFVRDEGHAEGMKKGMKEGRQARDKDIVLSMLKEKSDINFISKVTGLSEQKIKKLKKSSK